MMSPSQILEQMIVEKMTLVRNTIMNIPGIKIILFLSNLKVWDYIL